MAYPVRNMLFFGFKQDKQIDIGLVDAFINDYNQRNKSNLMKRLADLFTNFESLFDDQLQTQNTFELFFQFNEVSKVPDAWKYDNPPFGPHKQTCLINIIQKLIEIGVISEVTYTEDPKYLNSVNVIENDNEFELFLDSTALNDENNFDFTIDKMDPTYYINDIFLSIPPSTVFSKLVIKNPNYHFVLDKDHRKYTTFKLRIGDKDHYYEFNRLDQNMRISFNHMQKQFEKIFEKLIKESIVRIIGNQILVLSKTIDDHIVNLKKIFDYLSTDIKQLNMKISPKFSSIFFLEIQIYEFHLDDQGISFGSLLKDDIRHFYLHNRESRDWLRDLIVSYRKFFRISEQDYIKNQNLLNEDVYLKNPKNCHKAFDFFMKIFLNSKIPYQSQNWPQSSRPYPPNSSRSNLKQSLRSNFRRFQSNLRRLQSNLRPNRSKNPRPN